MKFCASLIFMLVVFIACRFNDTTKYDLENAMQSHLYSRINNDSSKVKYRVEDVEFFNDNEKNRYVCEFTVNMREFTVEGKARFDTTGKMKAYISKDFKTVTRLY